MRRLNTQTAQKQQKAIELRNLGINYDRIASELGYSDRSGAWRAVKAGLDRAIVEPAHEQRIIQSQRLDILVRQALSAVINGDLDQIPNVLRVEKRRAELWGLDAPKVTEISGPEGAPIRTDVGALLLERLQALSGQGSAGVASQEPLEVLPREVGSGGEGGHLEAIRQVLEAQVVEDPLEI